MSPKNKKFSPYVSFLDTHCALLTSFPIVISVGIYVMIMAVIYSSSPVQDADFWWHLKTGQVITETGSIPKNDLFSDVIRGKPWVTFEWLTQKLMWEIWSWAGAWGIWLWRGIMSALLFGLIFWFGRAAPLVTAGVLFLFLPFARLGLTERPQLFTFVLALSYRYLVPRYFESRQKWDGVFWILILALAHCVWSNLHGGASIIGLAIAIATFVGFLIDSLCTQPPAPNSQPQSRLVWSGFLLLGVLLLVSLVNPHSWRLYPHFISSVLDPAQQLIGEWRPPGVREPYFALYVFWLALSAVSSWGLEKKKRWTFWILWMALGLFGGFRSVRNVALAFFVLTPDLLEGLSVLLLKRPRWAAMAGIIGWAISGWGFQPLLAQVYPKYFELDNLSKEWGRGGVDFVLRHGIRGRVLNDYVLGGYLIWRLYPRQWVFMDGRSLEYGYEFLSKAIRWSDPLVFRELDARYQFDWAIFRQGETYLARHLDESGDWRCVYFDDAVLVYVHARRSNALIARGFGFNYLRPNETSWAYLMPLLENPQTRLGVFEDINQAAWRADREFSLNIEALGQFASRSVSLR